MPILPEHKEILLTQSESKTLPQWASFFNNSYTKSQIYNFCYHNKRPVKKIQTEERNKIESQNIKKYCINQDYFKTWNRNMAYVLGFWFANGCIYRGQCFDITIQKKDKYILKKIAEQLQYEGNLYDCVDKQAARINFSCKVIYDDLITLGGAEQKNNTIDFPQVPKEFLADFIRGYFDGDGCIMNLKNNRVNTAFASGSKKFLDALLEILKAEAGVTGGSYDPQSKSLRFGKKDSLKIGQYMYQNNPELFLLRKRKKFIKEDKIL